MRSKFILFTIAALGICKTSLAQQPANVSQYPFVASVKTFTYLTGGTTITSVSGSGDDGTAQNIPFGFSFPFGGSTYTSLSMCTNGWLSLSNSSGTGWTNSTSEAATFQPLIMPWYDDLASWISSSNTSYSGNMSYQTTGNPGSRVLTLQWLKTDVQRNYTFALSIQAKLYEDGGIEFLYTPEINTTTGQSPTIGIWKNSTDYQTLNSCGTAPIASSTTFTTTITGLPVAGQSYYFGIQKRGYNNASASSIAAPLPPFCPGTQNLALRVKNAGFNQINSLKIFWEMDGVAQTPVTYNNLVDTFGSTAGQYANVSLGNVLFAGSPHKFKIYTSIPNNQPDTVNGDDTLYITLGPSPTAIITPVGSTIFCTAGVINAVLNAPPGIGSVYQWKLNGSPIPGAIGQNYTATAAGDYSVQIDSNGCSNTSATIRVDNLAMPMPVVRPDGYPVLCNGDSLTLLANAGVTGASYQWKFQGSPIPGATNSSFVAYNPGNYTVVTSKLVCNATSQGINVVPQPAPTPTITDTVINNAHILKTDPSYVSYQWYISTFTNPVPTALPGDTLFICIPKQNGDYTVIASNGGCTGLSDTANVNYITSGGVNNVLSASIHIFPNPANDLLHIDAPAGSVMQLSGIDGRSIISQPVTKENINISFLSSGIYWIKISDQNGIMLKMEKLVKESR